ncbi:hypothetical protein HYV73_04760 [Candidatus Uhrbacteria bacterium]|nr:hypothetical protein [Candidatus Uhrbacteria bacterium]
MNKQLALRILFGIGVAGLVFSGYLSYQELWGTCPGLCPAPGTMALPLGAPACVYGFFMYLGVMVVAGLGVRAGK